MSSLKFPIGKAVGKNAQAFGGNKKRDIFTIQTLLNRFIGAGKLPGLSVLNLNGQCDETLEKAIRLFQLTYVPIKPDGRVDPGGGTLKYLNVYPPERITEVSITISDPGFNEPERWFYQGSSGWSVSVGSVISAGRVSTKLTVQCLGRDSENFDVDCPHGRQVSGGVSVNALGPVTAEWSGKPHKASGSIIQRMPGGIGPVSRNDFGGVILIDTYAGSSAGSLGYSIIRTFPQGSFWTVFHMSMTLGIGAAPITMMMNLDKRLDNLALTKGSILGESSSSAAVGVGVTRALFPSSEVI